MSSLENKYEYPVPVVPTTKPSGNVCNIACDYCTPDRKGGCGEKYTPLELMKNYLQQLKDMALKHGQEMATVLFQGSEPTLLPLRYYEELYTFGKGLETEDFKFDWIFQTNGQIIGKNRNGIGDRWCEFFKKTNALVGTSLDGPEELNANRKTYSGESTFENTVNAIELFKKHEIDWGVLCTVNKLNQESPEKVYNFFKGIGAAAIAFIPVVERDKDGKVTDYSVDPRNFGKFLSKIFELWLTSGDYKRVRVRDFDDAINVGDPDQERLCVHSKTCGYNPAMGSEGNIYSCDLFVDSKHMLGNILETPLEKLAYSEKQIQFGNDKTEKLPSVCLECPVLDMCQGGCPKYRFAKAPNGEGGLNYLCEGYKEFFMDVKYPKKRNV